jgi:hypothetical protein
VLDDDLRAYARRDWAWAARLKQRHWAGELAVNPLATFEAAQALWVHMRQVHPEWPGETERQGDLAHHVALRRALDAAASVLAPAARR